jgi:hypothetical protein
MMMPLRHVCEYCHKTFASRVGKCKHKRGCARKQAADSAAAAAPKKMPPKLETLLSSMQQELQALRNQLQQQQQQHTTVSAATTTQPITINHTTTTNTHHHHHEQLAINAQVNINAFGREDTQHLQPSFLDRCIRRTNVGLVELLDQLHFGNPSNRNVRITNRKIPLAEVNDGIQWKFEKKERVLSCMMDKGQDILQEHLEEHQDHIRQQLSETMWEHVQDFFQRMEVKDENTIRDILDDVYILLLNKTRVPSASSASSRCS